MVIPFSNLRSNSGSGSGSGWGVGGGFRWASQLRINRWASLWASAYLGMRSAISIAPLKLFQARD